MDIKSLIGMLAEKALLLNEVGTDLPIPFKPREMRFGKLINIYRKTIMGINSFMKTPKNC